MEKAYAEELSSPATEQDNDEDEDEDDDGDATVVDFGVEMVGNCDEFSRIRNELLSRMRPDDMCIFSFYGERGSGRTLVAKIVFDDLCKGKEQCFERCAWVRLGTERQLKAVSMRIIEQVDSVGLAEWEYELLSLKEDEVVCNYLYKTLENRRYMIVLDDVRDVKVVDHLRRWLPDQSNGSLVCVTTNFEEVALLCNVSKSFEMGNATYFEDSIYMVLQATLESDHPLLVDTGRKLIKNL